MNDTIKWGVNSCFNKTKNGGKLFLLHVNNANRKTVSIKTIRKWFKSTTSVSYVSKFYIVYWKLITEGSSDWQEIKTEKNVKLFNYFWRPISSSAFYLCSCCLE